MYWAVNNDGTYEVIDGQQRTISFCQYIKEPISMVIDGLPRVFRGLTCTEQDKILDYELLIYFCEGEEKDKLDWFKVVNIAGEKLTDQELLNATYTGTWLTHAKTIFSKPNCAAYLLAKDYVEGSPIRQEIFEKALKWINTDDVEGYMSNHQLDQNANELWTYFQNVINWVRLTFTNYRPSMKYVSWGPLYNKYKDDRQDTDELERETQKLVADIQVSNNKGIYEYLLSGKTEIKLLKIRVFDDAIKASKYEEQTREARINGESNCPLCAIGQTAHKTKIWTENEMEADHVTAWSNGGSTDLNNCQVLCKTHNRAKGNA